MQEERHTERRQDYSAWHRRKSTCRYVSEKDANLLSMIDLDAAVYVEYADDGKVPLALIETAQDVGQEWKSAAVTLNLARRADIPCVLLLYKLSDAPNPADARWRDIACFRMKRLHPGPPDKEWRTLTPQEWSDKLLEIRRWSEARLAKQDELRKTAHR